MKKIKRAILFSVLLAAAFGAGDIYGFDAMAQYNRGIRYIKTKRPDFALMEFRGVVRDYPESLFAQKALFAIAEYCYDNNICYEAMDNFTAYLNKYPGSESGIFAKAYLLKITRDIKFPSPDEKKAFENIKKDFFSKPLFLLFKEYKQISYKSPSLNRFKIRYYVDNIEVYRNGQLFIQITQ
jgi:outer membrane protein assembly factor BamD (BamD/ComL family)